MFASPSPPQLGTLGNRPEWDEARPEPDGDDVGLVLSDAPRPWQDEAACRDLPTDLFFPIGHGPHAQAQARLAKDICGACSVRAECLQYALSANMPYGVFGGMAEEERRALRRRLADACELDGSLEQSA